MKNEHPQRRYEEVLPLLNCPISGQGLNPVAICPLCGKKKFYFNVRTQKGECKNASCEAKGSPVTVYAIATGQEYGQALAELRRIFDGDAEPPVKVAQTRQDFYEDQPIADVEVLDKVYGELIKLSPLSNRHGKDMLARGLKKEEVLGLHYGSLSHFDKMGRMIAKEVGSPLGVPGFFKSADDDWCFKSWLGRKKPVSPNNGGILVPYKNFNNKIVGIQVRRNKEDLADGKYSKYYWLSTNGEKEGAKAHQFVHYACDWSTSFATGVMTPILGDTVRITEGAMKADIAHNVTGEPIIAIAGVNALHYLPQAIALLKQAGVKKILDTFDMDYISNESVRESCNKLKGIIQSQGLIYEREDWNPAYKGYDDFVVARRNGEV